MQRVSAHTSEGEGEVLTFRKFRGGTEVLIKGAGFGGWYLQGSFILEGEVCPDCHEGTLLPYDPNKNNATTRDFSTLQPDSTVDNTPTEATCDVCGHKAPLSDATTLPSMTSANDDDDPEDEDSDKTEKKDADLEKKSAWTNNYEEARKEAEDASNWANESSQSEEKSHRQVADDHKDAADAHNLAAELAPDLATKVMHRQKTIDHYDKFLIHDSDDDYEKHGSTTSPMYAEDQVVPAEIDAEKDEEHWRIALLEDQDDDDDSLDGEEDDIDDDGVKDTDTKDDEGGDSDDDSKDDENSPDFLPKNSGFYGTPEDINIFRKALQKKEYKELFEVNDDTITFKPTGTQFAVNKGDVGDNAKSSAKYDDDKQMSDEDADTNEDEDDSEKDDKDLTEAEKREKEAALEVYEDAPEAWHSYVALLNSDPIIKETAWKDVRNKGLRLRREGKVAVDLYEPHEIIQTTVVGDNGIYTTVVHTGEKGKANVDNHIAGFSCTCGWGKWSFNRETYFGRLCSHGIASYYEKQALDRSGSDQIITDPFRIASVDENDEEEYDENGSPDSASAPTIAPTESYYIGSDNEDLDSETILENFQREAAFIIEGNQDNDNDGFDFASAAEAHLAKTSGKQYSPAEQLALIYEGGDASNIDSLDLEGTNYLL